MTAEVPPRRGYSPALLLLLLQVAVTARVVGGASRPAQQRDRGAAVAPPAALIADVGLGGLVAAKDHFLPQVLAGVRGLVIKGESQKNFDYSDIHISSADLKSANVSFVPDNGGIRLSLTGLSLGTKQTNFEVKKKILFAHVHCSGHFSASIAGTDVVVSLRLENVGGRPQVAASSSIKFGKVSVTHHLNNEACKIGESIVSLFIGNVNKKIESEIKSKVPATVQTLLNTQVNKLLAGLQLSVEVDRWARANFSLAGNATNTDARLCLGFSARFEPRVPPPGGMPPTPCPAGSFPLVPPNSSQQLGLAFGAEILNSAFVVYASQGALTVNQTLPPNVTGSKAFGALMPALTRTFPNSVYTVALNISTPPAAVVAPPLLHIIARNMSVTLRAEQAGGGSAASTLALELVVSADANISISVASDGSFVSGKVLPGDGLRSVGIHVAHSAIGPIDAASLGAAVNLIIDAIGLPYVNSHFKGVPIPQVAGITLLHPSVAAVANEALVQTSLQFTNTSRQRAL